MRSGSIVLSAAELTRVQAQLEEHRWYREVFEGFRSRVDELVERSPGIPVVKGRAFFESCPVDHARLIFDPYSPCSHVCPKCGRDWVGEEFDLSWVRQFQDWLGKRLVEAGVVYRVLGSQEQAVERQGVERYAGLVRDSLAHFVEHYREYPLANNLLGPTRLFQSTYLEAFWLVDMVAAYDLTRSSKVYSAADHSGIRDLLYESCSVVRSFDEGVSNRQAFNNAGMGAVALLYEDEALLEHVLAGPHGFAFHMRESLLEDGIWYEGETYHFATLDHTLNLAEMARRRGIDLYRGESGYGSLRPMFDGPLRVMLPDLTFPSRKDSWFGRGIGYHREVYELGFARYGDERYGGLLAHAYANGTDRRDVSWRTFLYLEPDLPLVRPEPSEPSNILERDGTDTGRARDRKPRPATTAGLLPKECESMPGTGVAVLRRDEGKVYAGLEYGHYGGGHGHPDRLHLTLFANGVHWLVDPGTGWYHVPELGWYRSTLAHNTISIDGRLQNPREGSLTAFGDAGCYQAVQARVDELAEGVTARRTLLLGEGFLLDVVEVNDDSGEEHSYDWAFHTPARLESISSAGSLGINETTAAGGTENKQTGESGDGQAEVGLFGNRDGYQFLSNLTTAGSDRLDLSAELHGESLRVIQIEPAARFVATAPGIPLREDSPLNASISRRWGRRTRFATSWVWADDKARASLASKPDGTLQLELAGCVHRVQIDDSQGLTIIRESPQGIQGVTWFGRREATVAGVSLQSERALEWASLDREGESWHASLPEGFGALAITGLPPGQIEGLPTGAEWGRNAKELRIQQSPGAQVWLESLEPVTLFAGCSNDLAFNVGSYSKAPPTPKPLLPCGWRLSSLSRSESSGSVPSQWQLTLELPGGASEDEGSFTIEAGEERFDFRYRVQAPLSTSWKVDSAQGAPAVTLELQNVRDVGARVHVKLQAPWLSEPAVTRELELATGSRKSLTVSLPLQPPSGPQAACGKDADLAELPGLTDSSGGFLLSATLSVAAFRGISKASVPLYWSRPSTSSWADDGAAESRTLRLGREDQALWADRRWRGESDASAQVRLEWSPGGLHLHCLVTDDCHVSDANEDDLYENDSLQVYFDFRRSHHTDRNFTPGVAAYVLAPNADKDAVRVKEIAGNREISNRGAKAGWFTANGVHAECKPTGDGYEMEVFFPYSSLGVDPLRPGRVIGFDLSLSDNDGTWYRNTQLLWSGSRGRRCYIRGSYHDPREFGWLIVGE